MRVTTASGVQTGQLSGKITGGTNAYWFKNQYFCSKETCVEMLMAREVKDRVSALTSLI